MSKSKMLLSMLGASIALLYSCATTIVTETDTSNGSSERARLTGGNCGVGELHDEGVFKYWVFEPCTMTMHSNADWYFHVRDVVVTINEDGVLSYNFAHYGNAIADPVTLQISFRHVGNGDLFVETFPDNYCPTSGPGDHSQASGEGTFDPRYFSGSTIVQLDFSGYMFLSYDGSCG